MNNVREYFEQLFTEQVKRPGAAELLEWLGKSDFYQAPASTRFHLARPGGLVEHSLHVYERLKQLCECETLNNPAFKAPSPESIAVVGLLHDICKVGVYVQEPKNQACPKYSEHFPKRGNPVFQTIFRHNGEIQGKFFKNPNFQGKLELQKMFAIVRGKWDTPRIRRPTTRRKSPPQARIR